MKPSNQLTPFPILASFRDDYIDSQFQTETKATQHFGDLMIESTYKLTDEVLSGLIRNDLAEYVVHIECPVTSFRKCIKTGSSHVLEVIPCSALKGSVEICTFIVAKQRIKDYCNPAFHPDYRGMSFDILPGSTLAIGNSVVISIENDDDMAHKSSLIKIIKAGASQKDAMAVNTDQSDAILISLRPELHEIYALYGDGKNADLIFSLILLPALQVVLSRMLEAADTDYEKEWFVTIRELLDSNGIDLASLNHYNEQNSVLSVAQQMLSQPLTRALLEIKKDYRD